jgi:uncharacterized membrane protein
MQALGGLSSDQIMAIELLWTPQGPEVALTQAETLRCHPRALGE